MQRLFLKLFSWFWATVMGAAVTLALIFRLGPGATPERWHVAWVCALIVSGLICYLLTRYLTGPVLRLQEAARLLAAGDLHARAEVTARRRDEIGDLVHDFNVMANRLEELVAGERQLISDISHELRSPLTRLNATIGLARQRTGANTLFDRMERDTDRLNTIIGRLLTLARLDATGIPPEMHRTDLTALVSEIVADTEWEAQERRCRVMFDGSEHCYGLVNADLLRSAVEDLVRNGIRYTAPGSAVGVTLERPRDQGNTTIIRVCDQGTGLPASELSNIFRPFYRVAGARDRESGGVGLGLAIAARVAQLHRGHIYAENRPNGGLEVVMILNRS